MAEGTGFSTGKVVKLLAPAAEIENAQWEAPVRKETEKQSYHRAKNFRRYTTKAAARNWEIKKAWKTLGAWISPAFGKHWKKINYFARVWSAARITQQMH